MKVLHINGAHYWMKDSKGKIHKFIRSSQWKTNLRKEPLELIKELSGSLHCSVCGIKDKLTIDHDPPLNEKPWESKITILCTKCHSKKNRMPKQELDYIFLEQNKLSQRNKSDESEKNE